MPSLQIATPNKKNKITKVICRICRLAFPTIWTIVTRKDIGGNMRKHSFALGFAFLLGYFCHDLTNSVTIIPKAYADLTGIDYYELRGDRDFKQAVEYVVENCGVEGTGYVEGDRLYGFEGDIRC